MFKLRKLIPLLMIVALALVALPVSAAILPVPALYQCTVYEDGVLVGAGKTVEAFVGTETTARDSADTNASGVAVLQFSVDGEEILEALSFKVDGYVAAEDPDVDVWIGGLTVSLDYTTGEVPDISVSPTSIAFGDVTVGSSSSETLSISNEGTADLVITSITTTDAQFSATAPGVTNPIAAGSSYGCVVTFTPASTGAKSATLSIVSNDPDEATVTVSLSGTGVTTVVPSEFVTYADWVYDTFIA